VSLKIKLRKFIEVSLGFPLGLLWLAIILKHLRALRLAEVVIVQVEGGFGHTLTGPDAARRLYPRKRIVFIVLSEPGRHNPLVAELWSEMELFFLPVGFRARIGFQRYTFLSSRFKRKASVDVFLKFFCNKLAIEINELYDSIPTPPGLDLSRSKLINFTRGVFWPLSYFQLQKDVPALPIFLPAPAVQKLEKKLADFRARNGNLSIHKTCGLYLRQKGVDSDKSSSRRVGSSLDVYEAGLQRLVEAGYQIFVIGDATFQSRLAEKFSGMLVFPQSLGVRKSLFDLYAATTCSIFVGETGGGIWVPCCNRIPMLLMNVYPFYTGATSAWIMFKTLKDERGERIHYRDIFTKYVFDPDLDGLTLCSNSSEEIEDAISEFLRDPISAGNQKLPLETLDIEKVIPPDTGFKAAGSRLSPAYAKIYNNLK